MAKHKRKETPSSFTRTEGSFSYTYGRFIAFSFSKWAAVRRDHEITPLFFNFYSKLPPEEKAMVTVAKKTKDPLHNEVTGNKRE